MIIKTLFSINNFISPLISVNLLVMNRKNHLFRFLFDCGFSLYHLIRIYGFHVDLLLSTGLKTPPWIGSQKE